MRYLAAALIFLVILGGIKYGTLRFGDKEAIAAGTAEDLATQQLETVLKERATAALSQRLQPHEYRIKITVQMIDAKNELKVPYLPERNSIEALRQRPIQELRTLAPKVKVEALIDPTFADSGYAELAEMLSDALLVKKGRDEVQISKSKIRRIPDDSAATAKDQELNSVKRELKTAERDRNDAKNELISTKSELDRIAREMFGLKALSEKELRDGPESTSFKNLVRAHAGLFALALLLFGSTLVIGVLIFLYTNAVRSSYRTLGGAIESVSAALAQISGGKGEPTNGVFKLEAENGLGSTEKPQPAANNVSLEEGYKRLEILKAEILEMLSMRSDGPVVSFINQQLGSPGTIVKAMLALELVGDERGSKFFHMLDSAKQDMIRDAVNYTLTRPKVELMIECGEEIKTRLLLEHTKKIKGEASDHVASLLSSLGEAELPAILEKLDDTLALRLMVHLKTETVVRSLNGLYTRNMERFTNLSQKMSNISQVFDQKELDGDLAKKLDTYTSTKKLQSAESFIPFYRKILSMLDEKPAEQLLSGLSNNEELANSLRGVIVTYRSFFETSQDLFREIVESLPTKNLVALVADANDDEAKRILQVLNEIKRDLIIDEVGRLKEKGTAKAQQAAKQARAMVTQRLRQAVDTGDSTDVSMEAKGAENISTGSPELKRVA